MDNSSPHRRVQLKMLPDDLVNDAANHKKSNDIEQCLQPKQLTGAEGIGPVRDESALAMDDLLPHQASSYLVQNEDDERKMQTPRISINASFINRNTSRMRTRSQTLLYSKVNRTKSKAMTLGALNRQAKELKAAHGDDFSSAEKRSRRDDRSADRYVLVAKLLLCCCRRCCGRWKPIEADSRMRRTWDAAQVLLLLYVAIAVPLRTGFDDGEIMVLPLTALWWFELAVDIYFIVDVILNFNTTYVDSTTMIIVRDPTLIQANYLKGWFALDLVACLPVAYIQQITQRSGSGSGTSQQLKALKTVRLFRLAKLLRLARIRRIIKRWEDLISAGLMFTIQISMLLFAVVFSAHIITCSWYLLGQFNDPESLNQTVSVSQESSALVPGQPSDEAAGWVYRKVDGKHDFSEQPLVYRYLRTYYWSVGLTSGSARGDIPPTITAEFLFVISMEVAGTVVLGLILGSLSSMFTSTRLLEDKVERQMAELREYLNERNVPSQLRARIRHYMELFYRKRTGYDERKLLANLPPTLGRQLLEELYESKIEAVPGMRGLPDEVRARLCMAMKPMKALKKDVIYKEGELAHCVYVIEVGAVELSRTSVVLMRLSSGAAFGEDALVGDAGPSAKLYNSVSADTDWSALRIHRERTATAMQDSELVAIETKDIGPIADAYPALHERLAKLHSKRHAKEQQRLVKMLEQKAKELGVSPQSTIIAKIKEKAEALMEENSAILTAQETKAAIRIQRVFRGNRFRRAMHLQMNCERTEANVDTEKEAVKLLRTFSIGTFGRLLDSSDETTADETPPKTAETSIGSKNIEVDQPKEHVQEVAQKSWKRIQQSRAEFQRQYREKASRPTPSTDLQLMAKIESLEASVRALQSKDLLHGLEDRLMQTMGKFFAIYVDAGGDIATQRTNAQPHPEPSPEMLSPASDSHLGSQSEAKNAKARVERDVVEWLHSRQLGGVEDALGSLGTTMSDFMLLSEQDIDELGLKPLTRRRLVQELSQLDGSVLSIQL